MGDEVSDLFLPDPAGPSLDVRYRQGVIVSFDPITLENEVLVGGQVLSNLPLQGVGEVGLLVPGAVVGVMVVGGPTKTMYINGRVVSPNTADATNAVSLLNSLVYADQVAVQETASSTSFLDLTTVGPKVTVPVGPTGRLLVVCTSQIQWIVGYAANPAIGGWCSVQMSGANTMTPSTAGQRLLPTFNISPAVSTGTIAEACQVTSTAAAVFDGLNSGDTTLVMKYACQWAGTNVDFGRRTLTVIKL